MKYILLASLIGFFSWPYYHRMRTFGWDYVKSYAVGLIPAAFLSLGILQIVLAADAGTLKGYPHYPDLLTKLTFIAIAAFLTVLLAWLTFTAKTVEDVLERSSDVPIGDCILILILSMAQAALVSNLFIQALL